MARNRLYFCNQEDFEELYRSFCNHQEELTDEIVTDPIIDSLGIADENNLNRFDYVRLRLDDKTKRQI